MKLGILAGEASGDILGAGLLQELQKLHPDLTSTGIAGPEMLVTGCHTLYDMERLSIMGLIEPLFRLRELFKIRNSLHQHFLHDKPDVFIGIDSPDFNLNLEYKLRQAGIPTVHYVSPSVWAWRKKRIFKIAKSVDLILTLFPFEADFYKQHGVPVCFVGHPLADLIPLQPDKLAARNTLGLLPDATYITILPGSRQNEIKYLGAAFAATAALCYQKNPNLQFITSAANAKRHQEFQAICRAVAPQVPIKFFQGCSHAAMSAADATLVASGTATLEAMLFKQPMVIAYRMAGMTYQIARHLVKIPFIGLPNLLAGESLVPEFIQNTVQPEAMSKALLNYLDHPEKIQQLEKRFTMIHEQLRCNANQKAAKAVLQLIQK